MEVGTTEKLNPKENELNAMPSNDTAPEAEAPVLPELQEAPLFDLKKRDLVFAALAAAFCIFTSVFGIFGGFALGYLISCVLMLGLFVFYFSESAHFKFLPIFCGILSLVNAATFICTSNGSVRFFGVVISFLLSLVCFSGLVSGSAKGNRETFVVFYSAAMTVCNLPTAIKSLFINDKGDKKTVGKVLIGLAGSIPLLIIIVPLLISSDDAFRGMMDNLFSDSLSKILKAIFGLVLSLLAVSYGFSLKKSRVAKVERGEMPGIENAYVISFLSAINLCYLLYLFSQLAYFFSAFSGFLPNGQITYAEYARKGFFEMCIIAVINLIVVFLVLLIAKKENGKVCHAVKATSTFIGVFTLIIIATAISKMVLYIDAYGMTVLRLTTSAFMLFLAVVFISVILRIFFIKINILKTALITAGVIVLLLGTVNVNGVCAKYNFESYVSGRLSSVDVEAMYELGDEGIPYLVKLTEDKNSVISDNAKKYLAKAYVNDYFEEFDKDFAFKVSTIKGKEKFKGFEQFSIPRATAYKELYAFLEENPLFGYECRTLAKDAPQ